MYVHLGVENCTYNPKFFLLPHEVFDQNNDLKLELFVF